MSNYQPITSGPKEFDPVPWTYLAAIRIFALLEARTISFHL